MQQLLLIRAPDIEQEQIGGRLLLVIVSSQVAQVTTAIMTTKSP